MDNGMKKVTDEFITQRINHYGKNETESANSAFMELRTQAERLKEMLTKEQQRVFNHCENAYRVADGENSRFYYTAGFSDAIRFFADWMERP